MYVAAIKPYIQDYLDVYTTSHANFSLSQFDKYSATFCWLLALAIAIAVFPFFDFNLKSAPCKTKYFTLVRWPFLAATCSGVQPDMSANSTSPPCWISSLRTSRCPFAAALCTAVEPDSSNSFGLWNECYSLPYGNKTWVQNGKIIMSVLK